MMLFRLVIIALGFAFSVHSLSLPRSTSTSTSAVLTTRENSQLTFPRLKTRGLSRNLLTFTNLKCGWDSQAKKCIGGLDVARRTLVQSNSSLAEFSLTALQCTLQTNRIKCQKTGYCTWNKSRKDCAYLDYTTLNSESPCVETAPGFFANLRFINECPNFKKKKGCRKTKGCYWDPFGRQCEADSIYLFYGIKSNAFFEGQSQYISQFDEEARAQFALDFDTSSDQFDWNLVLDWNPSLACADGDDKACIYSQALISYSAPYYLYCGGRYPSGQDDACNADPLCESFGDCNISSEIRTNANLLADEALAATIPFTGDSEYTSASDQCFYNFDPDSCASKENCVWDISTETCELTAVAYTDIIIRAAGNDTTDPICAQLEYTASTGCIDIHDENVCSSKSECFFSGGNCDVTVSAIELAAVADNPNLADQIVNLNLYCGSFADKKACTT